MKKIKYYYKIFTDLVVILFKKPYIFSSYPKSGSTYIRFFLFNFLLKLEKLSPSLKHSDLNENFPEIGRNNLIEAKYNWVIKTHHNAKFYNQKKVLRVIRNPYESLCSAYEYYNRSTHLNYGSINEFLKSKRGIKDYLNHFKICKKNIKNEEGLVIKYENLIMKPKENFSKILSFFDLKYTDEDLSEVLNIVSRENQIKFESSNKRTKNFSSKKSYEKYKSIIDENLLQEIDFLTMKYNAF